MPQLYSPDELMATEDWQSLPAQERSTVVDNWSLEARQAFDWTPEQTRELDGIIDDFHAKAAETKLEATGRIVGEGAKSGARSMAALPGAAAKLATQAGKAGGIMLDPNLDDEQKREALAREAPDALSMGLNIERTVTGAGTFARQNNPLSEADEQWEAALEALKRDVLERKLPEEPDALFDALRKHGLDIARSTAKLHGEDLKDYFPLEYQALADEPGLRRNFTEALGGKKPAGFAEAHPTLDLDRSPDDPLMWKNQSRSLVASPENLGLLMQFSATRNPAYFDALKQRLGRSRTAQRQDAAKSDIDAAREEDVYDKATRWIFGLGGNKPEWGETMVQETRGVASSPVDAASTLFSFGLGRGVMKALKAGAYGTAAGKVALGTGAEFIEGAASALADKPVPGTGGLVEEGLMEVAGGKVIEAAGAGYEALAGRNRTKAAAGDVQQTAPPPEEATNVAEAPIPENAPLMAQVVIANPEEFGAPAAKVGAPAGDASGTGSPAAAAPEAPLQPAPAAAATSATIPGVEAPDGGAQPSPSVSPLQQEASDIGLPAPGTTVNAQAAHQTVTGALGKIAQDESRPADDPTRVVAAALAGADFNETTLTVVDDSGATLASAAEGGKQSQFAGGYDPGSKTIVLNTASRGRGGVGAGGTLVHEALHHVAQDRLTRPRTDADRRVASALIDLMRQTQKHSRAQGDAETEFDYEFRTVDEFFTAVATRPDLQARLREMPAEPKSGFRNLWEQFVNLIARLLKREPRMGRTALDDAVGNILKLVKTTPETRAQTGTSTPKLSPAKRPAFIRLADPANPSNLRHEQAAAASEEEASLRDPGRALARIRGGAAGLGDESAQETARLRGQGRSGGAEQQGSRLFPEIHAPSLIGGLHPLEKKKGAEHLVYFDPASNRVVKLTNPGEFGAEGGLEEYLQRLDWANKLFGDDYAVEGVVQYPNEEGTRLVTTQPWYRADENKPHPTQAQIDQYMRDRGFLKAYDGAYIHEVRDIIASDAVPKNFVQTPAGRVHPVDVILMQPSSKQNDRLTAMAHGQPQLKPNPNAKLSPSAPLAPGEREPGALGPEPEVKQRSFGKRVAADERLGAPLRAQFPANFVPIPNVETLEQANAIIEHYGLDEAARLVTEGTSGMPEHVRVIVGHQAMLRYDEAAAAAQAAGAAATAYALWDKSYKVGSFVDTLGTAAGRAIQAFTMWARMTPDGVLHAFEKRLREKNDGKMPTLPRELLKKLGPLVKKINAAPEGSAIRQDLMRQLMAELARYEGIKPADVLSAYWYANILSGPNTQAINVFGNGLHLFLRGLSLGVVDPKGFFHFVSGLLSGVKRGHAEARAALRGEQVVKSENKYTQPSSLELLYGNDAATFRRQILEQFKDVLSGQKGVEWGRTKAFFAFGRYVFRLLSAADVFFYRTATEGRAHVAAARFARQQVKANGGDFGAYLAEALASAPSKWLAALTQAADDLRAAGRQVNTREQERRAWEIIEKQRPPELNKEAARFGELATFTGEPQGLMGAIAQGINWMLSQAVIPTRWGDFRLLQPVIPFVNIVANVTSAGLDFTPLGLVRAAKGGHIVGTSNDAFTREERMERVGSAMLGMLATGIVAAIANAFKDDDDPPFMITAQGPQDKAKRQQLMQAGWVPYSIKVGNTYIRYAETPLVVPFSMVGGWLDKHRFNEKWSEESLGMRLAYVAGLFPKAWTDSGFLSSVGQIMDAARGDAPWSGFITRTASGIIPGQGFLRDLARITDPEKVDDTSLLVGFYKDVPFFKKLGTRPALNVFGDPVRIEGLQRLPVVSRIASGESQDKEAVWLAQHRLFISGLDYTDIGINLSSPNRMEKLGLEAIRAERANRLGRQYAEVLTDREAYVYAQRAGQLTRQAVKQLRTQFETNQISKPDLQDRLEKSVSAARKVAKRDLLFRTPSS